MLFSFKRCCSALVAVAAVFCAISSVEAQGGPGGRGGFGFGGPGGGFGGGSELFLLRNDQVREELGIVDEQVEKLEALGNKAREQMRELFSGMGDLSREEREAKMEEIRTKMQSRAEEMKKEMETILLPNQVKRLEQISRQTRMRMGPQGGGNSEVIATELKLSDEQKEKLRAKAEEVEKKLREKMAKLRKESEDEILSVLTPEQRAQWKEMVGDPFELQFGRPGRGGPGGGGGGGAPGARPADGF